MANEFFKGLLFGLGQSVAGIIVVTFLGKSICKYVYYSMKEFETQEIKKNIQETKPPETKLKIKVNRSIDESLLSDGETIQIHHL